MKIHSAAHMFLSPVLALALAIAAPVSAAPSIPNDPQLSGKYLEQVFKEEIPRLDAYIAAQKKRLAASKDPKVTAQLQSDIGVHTVLKGKLQSVHAQIAKNPVDVGRIDWTTQRFREISQEVALGKYGIETKTLSLKQIETVGLIYRTIDRLAVKTESGPAGSLLEPPIQWGAKARFTISKFPPSAAGAKESDQHIEITTKMLRSDENFNYFEAKAYQFGAKWYVNYTYEHAIAKAMPIVGEKREQAPKAQSDGAAKASDSSDRPSKAKTGSGVAD